MTPVLLAAPGIALEPALVASAAGTGVIVRRRCVDAVELLAAAVADPDALAVVSCGLPRLSADVITRLRHGRGVVGLASTTDEAARLQAIGVPHVVVAAGEAVDVLADIVQAVPESVPAGTVPDSVQPGASAQGRDAGAVVAVWGPMGSPGRTTVAIGVAEALAQSGRRVLLVDADTYAPSITATLGIVEEASGLIVAARQGQTSRLGASALRALARSLSSTWDVLGGLPAVDRWPDLSPGGLERVWQVSRAAYDVTVVDTGFCVEQDDDAVWGSNRNAAAITAVAAADSLIAVADASAAGLIRLAWAWPGVEALRAGRPSTVVRNRAGRRDRPWEDEVRRCGIEGRIHPIPSDARALEACWREGRSLSERGRRTPLRQAFHRVAQEAVSG